MRKFYPASIFRSCFLIFVLVSSSLHILKAQTTLTTLPNPPYNGSNGAGTNTAVTFVVENTNAFPVLLTNVGSWINSTDAAGTYQLWYSSTSLAGAPTISAPQWTQISQVTNFAAPSVSGITNIFTPLSFTIPAGTQYRFAVWYVTTGSHYSGTGVGTVTPSTFSGGGVNFKLGDVQIGGLYVGYGGANNPRWFTGTISFQPAGPCTSPPVAGTVVASSNPSCSGANFTVNLSGGTGGTGQTYQWQSSANNINWTNVSGGTSAILATSQTTNTYYRCYATCGGLTDTSSSLLVTTSICYCTSIPTSAIDEEIFSVTVNGATNAYNCTTVAPGPGSILNRYSNFYPLGPLTTLIPGANVPFTIQEDECDGPTYFSNGCAVWIDFNRNGVFTDPGEQVYVENATTQSPRTITGNFTVPITASAGLTGMRIIVAENFSGTGLQPCMTYTYGETEDYLVNIAPSTPCSGTPEAGTAVSSKLNVCAGENFNLSLTGNTIAAALTYQWQSSTDNINWTNITGAASIFYTTNQSISHYYRNIVTCTNSGASDTSSHVQVVVLSGPPIAAISASPSDTVCNGIPVSLTTVNCPGCTYTWSTGATTNSINVTAAGFYSVTVVNSCGTDNDSKEIIYKPGPSLSINATNAVCTGASTQIEANGAITYSWSPATGLNTTTGPVVIASPAVTTTYTVTGFVGTCSGSLPVTVTVNAIPGAPTATASGTTTFCEGGSVTLTSSAAANNQWYKDGTIITGAINQTYIAAASGNYTVKTTSNNCISNASAAVSVTVNSIPVQPIITQVGNALQSSAPNGNQWFLNGVIIAGATSSAYTPATSGQYTVQVTANGCTGPVSAAFNYTVTAVNNPVLDRKITVVPNPVSDILMIRYNGTGTRFSFMLVNVNGAVVLQNSFTTSYDIDMKKYSAGLYIIRIIEEKKGSMVQRMIVKQ